MSNNGENAPLLNSTGTNTGSNDVEGQRLSASVDTSRTLKVFGGVRVSVALIALVVIVAAISKGYDDHCASPLRGFLVFYLVVNTVMMMYTSFVLLGANETTLLIKHKTLSAFLVMMIISTTFLIFAYKDGTDCNHHIVMASRIVAPIELCFVLLEKCLYEFIYSNDE